MAAIAPPFPALAQRPMASARSRIRENASGSVRIPDAAMAAYSPKECPATAEHPIPASSMQANAAMETARIAG